MSLESLRQMQNYNRRAEDTYQAEMKDYLAAKKLYDKAPLTRKVTWSELTAAQKNVYYKRLTKE